ncbi:MAG: chemotaxis protein CheW [Pseudomonadota bacterium]
MTNEQEKKAEDGAKELVAFVIGDQEYCVDIMTVREIRGWSSETALPQSPNFVRGVINLRGSVVPIMDLATRLGLAAPEPTSRHVIMITQIGPQIVGLLVDAVSDILTITLDKVQPTPDVASETVREFITGVIALDGRMIRLLDLSKTLPTDDSLVEAA